MLKINYVLNHWSPTASTHFAHIQNLLDVLRLQGCQINLFIEKAPDGLPAMPGISVHRLLLRLPVARHIELMLRLGWQIFRGYKATFVRISAPSAIAASLSHAVFGGKAFLWQSGATHQYDRSMPISLAKMKWMLISAMPNYVARMLCQRFVTGPETMVTYYQEVVGVPERKIRLLYNDINLDVWGRSKDAAALSYFARVGVARPKIVLLLVHRLSPVRRTTTYLKPLLKRLRDEFREDWGLVIAGDGSELPDLIEVAKSLGVGQCCHFLGAVPNTNLHELYRSADVFINPSSVEGFPRVILEAMAYGLPIVTTDAGGTRDLLGPKQSDWVVDRDAPEHFSERVIELLLSESAQGTLSAENLKLVQRFSTPRVAEMYIEVMRDG